MLWKLQFVVASLGFLVLGASGAPFSSIHELADDGSEDIIVPVPILYDGDENEVFGPGFHPFSRFRTSGLLDAETLENEFISALVEDPPLVTVPDASTTISELPVSNDDEEEDADDDEEDADDEEEEADDEEDADDEAENEEELNEDDEDEDEVDDDEDDDESDEVEENEEDSPKTKIASTGPNGKSRKNKLLGLFNHSGINDSYGFYGWPNEHNNNHHHSHNHHHHHQPTFHHGFFTSYF